MQQNTITKLSSLRIGDSFVFITRNWINKKVDYSTGSWQVMALADKAGYVAVNQVSEVTRLPLRKKDYLKQKNLQVKFIRHTKPVAGEKFFLVDLEEGDIFKMVDDDVHEYVLQKKHSHFYDVRKTSEAACIKGGKYATVIFLRHKEVK